MAKMMTKKATKRANWYKAHGFKPITFEQSQFINNGKLDKDLMRTEYKKLAKQADTRLRRIEKLSTNADYTGIKEMAYRKAMVNIDILFGGGTTFDRTPPDNVKSLRKALNLVSEFLNSQTSTISGIKKLYSQREETFKEKFGVEDLTDAVTFFEKGYAKKFSEILASQTLLQLVGKFQKDSDSTRKWAKSLLAGNKKIPRNSSEFVAYIARRKQEGAITDEQILNFI